MLPLTSPGKSHSYRVVPINHNTGFGCKKSWVLHVDISLTRHSIMDQKLSHTVSMLKVRIHWTILICKSLNNLIIFNMEISDVTVMTSRDEKFNKVIYSHWTKLEHFPFVWFSMFCKINEEIQKQMPNTLAQSRIQ